ncbi:reticulon-like protein B9-like [Hibiscus syriacus]|uniref:Reticulon-like protein B9-like n=1 Tax=Hibiscus syriacus TaxID=106335 RepID=A0A6A2XHD9_HIBSY|nr:reticulon-like protein B9-like [Hibiscus syriacus]
MSDSTGLITDFFQSSDKPNTFLPLPKQPSCFSLAALIRSQPRFYSTDGGGGGDDDDVSTEELKMRIQKFFDGDVEAIPSIFEGILKRKLTGKHDESDDELMR